MAAGTGAVGRGERWTFLTNHAAVFLYIADNPDAPVLEIAQAVGLRERATAAIIADLRRAGYVRAVKVGRRNSYSVAPELPLRRESFNDVPIRHLLELIKPNQA